MSQSLENCKLRLQCDNTTMLLKLLNNRIVVTFNAGKDVEKLNILYISNSRIKLYSSSRKFDSLITYDF